jgi:PAS domain S-box-containing protein
MAKATYLLRKASELVRDRRYQDAVEVYLRATETDPTDSRAWFGLGVCLFRVGNLDVSRIALQRARHMGYPRADEALARVDAAEQRRTAEGSGAKPTVAPAEAEKRAAQRPVAVQGPPPRPTMRPADQKIELDRPLRVMLVEDRDKERHLITRCIEGAIRDVEVVSVPYGVSTSETMSGTVHYDAAVLDWDRAPDATAGLIQILKIKRPTLFVICLTEDWDPETAVEILEAGADYHLVKNAHFVSVLPLILAQWADRDYAVTDHQAKQAEKRSDRWSELLDSLGEMLVLVDTNFTIMHANQAALKGFSKGQEQVIGRQYFEVFYGEDEPPDACPIASVLERQEAASGKVHNPELGLSFSVRAWPVRARGGKLSGVVALLSPEAPAEAAAAQPPMDLLDRINAGVVTVRPDGALGYVNRAFCTMMDQTQEELAGQSVKSIVPVQEQETLRECLEEALQNGQSGERLTLQRADGSTVPVEARVGRFTAGSETHLAVALMAVGELERAEQELWAKAKELTGILDDAVDKLECGVVVLDNKGCVTWANTLAADLLGKGKPELGGQSYVELLRQALKERADDVEGFVSTVARSHQNGQRLEGYSVRLNAEGDTLRYSSTPLEGGATSVSRLEHFYLGEPAPATQPPQAGAELLAQIAGILPDMVFALDAQGAVTWCNPAAASVSGYAHSALVGMPLAKLAAENERGRLQKMLDEALNDGRAVERRELAIVRADGRQRWAEITLLPAPAEAEPARRAVRGILRDVTDRKVTESIRAILAGEHLPSPAA